MGFLKQKTSFINMIGNPAIFKDIVGLPNRIKQIAIKSKIMTNDFYVKIKGQAGEEFINKNYQWTSPYFPKGYIDTVQTVYQIKGYSTFTIEYS